MKKRVYDDGIRDEYFDMNNRVTFRERERDRSRGRGYGDEDEDEVSRGRSEYAGKYGGIEVRARSVKEKKGLLEERLREFEDKYNVYNGRKGGG